MQKGLTWESSCQSARASRRCLIVVPAWSGLPGGAKGRLRSTLACVPKKCREQYGSASICDALGSMGELPLSATTSHTCMSFMSKLLTLADCRTILDVRIVNAFLA